MHGFRKEEAIREVTKFFESHNESWVHIITGTGSHSQHGGVLKVAIESLLNRREMEFKKTSPGSFLVNAASGIVFYEPMQPTDSKVVLQPRDDEYVLVKLPPRVPLPPGGGVHRPLVAAEPTATATPVAAAAMGEASEDETCAASAAVAPCEDAAATAAQSADDELRLLELAQEESLKEAKRLEEAQNQIEQDYERIMRLSIVEDARRKAEEEQKLEDELRKALELSTELVKSEEHEEECLLRQVLEKSQEESKSSSAQEDEEVFRLALEQSLKEKSAVDVVLQRSLNETSVIDEEVRLALQRSLNESSTVDVELLKQEEERLIQEAIALSLRYS